MYLKFELDIALSSMSYIVNYMYLKFELDIALSSLSYIVNYIYSPAGYILS